MGRSLTVYALRTNHLASHPRSLSLVPRVGFSVSRSFPSCFACGHSLLPVQPSPSGEEWKVGSEKQARIHTVNNMSEKNPDGKHAIFKRKLTV